MAMNLTSVLKITAEVTGLQSLTQLEKGIEGAEKAANAAGKGFKAMLDSGLFKAAAAAAVGLGAAIGISAKAAIDFETSMAGVRKVVDGLESPEAFKQISNEIKTLSSQMPIAAKGFADIYAAAGQAGIAREDLKQFATQVAQVAVAFDMTAEEAGNAMAKIKTSLGLGLPALQDLTDAINTLGNNTAATAKDIVDFTLRAGQAGQSAGLTAEQTAAFGAAMIASGAQSEVAATSFNNMVKALSRGESMTERQIAAITKLGYVQGDAAKSEQQLTAEVEMQSQKRIEAARNETNEISKEINRRYRDQLQSIRDGFDDQSKAFEDSLQDQANAQIKALQRRQEAELDALRQGTEESNAVGRDQINAIQDRYEQEINVIRDNLNAQLQERRRADRDRLQAVQDGLDDQKDVELQAVQSRFSETQKLEEQNKKIAIDSAKQFASEQGKAAALQLAKGLQENAIGTITDVFNRIKQLPKEMQLSVISDLFGDEARAILPLINNQQLLEKSLGLVADKFKYTGSATKEYEVQAGTTANQVKLAQNNLENLSITFGQTFAPAISAAMKAIAPLIEGFTWMIQNIPGLGPVLGILAGAFVALVAVAPGLASIVFVLQSIGGAAALLAPIAGFFASIAGAAGAVIPVLSGIGATIAGFAGAVVPVLTGIVTFLGPQGLIALGIIALGVLFFTFREQIIGVFNAIISFVQSTWTTITSLLNAPIQAAITFIQNNFLTPISQGITNLVDAVKAIWQGLGQFLTSPFETAATTIKGVVNSILNGIGNAVGSVVNAINSVIAGANRALARLNLPQIPLLPSPNIPQFADGGLVTGPTLAMVGEGGEPEYIVPQSKANAFAANWMAGVRGPAAIPRFAEGGVVTPSTANVSIQTGPVTQMNGTNFVTTQDMTAAVRAGVQQTLDLIRRDGNVRTQLGLA